MLTTFASPNSSQALHKAVLLIMVFNGDWADHDTVQHIVGQGADSPKSPEAIRDLMESTLVAVACATKPGLWPRSRWTGAEQPLNQFGILSAVHGIFLPSLSMWLESHNSSSLSAHAMHAETAAQSSDHASHAVTDLLAGADVDIMEAVGTASGTTGDLMAALNSKHRKEAQKWVSSDPGALLLVARTVQEPLREFLQRQFHYSSQDYQAELLALIAQSSQCPGSQDRQLRFPIVIASELEVETTFMQRMNALLFQKSYWSSLPSASLTLNMQHLIFQLISRSAAAIHQLHVHVRSSYPFRLFQVVLHPERAAELEHEPNCLKDPFTMQIQQQLGFTGEICRQTLTHMASLIEVDISSIEARYASIRRQLFSKSCQTWTLPLTLASAEWIFQNCRRHVHGPPECRKARKVGT